MNQPPVERGISTRPVDDGTLLAWVQREASVVLRALLAMVNRLTMNSPSDATEDGEIDATTDIVRADATAGSFTLTLPATPAAWIRRVVIIKTDATVNTVTITGSVFGPIVLSTQWSIFEIGCDGVSYY